MKKRLIFISIIFLGIAVKVTAAYQEIPVEISDAEVKGIIADAPKVPVSLGLALTLELVDYIDCTNPKDLHPMMDQGTSSITSGPAGKYRVTAQGRNSFFSYRWKSASQDVPHILVIEYPDDAKREIGFLTHESQMSGEANADWSLETGVYTGNPLPASGKMQYHTMFFWPQDKWPVIIVGNWNRQGAPAAASRIWIYRVSGDHLPPMKVKDADPANPRLIGDLYNWSLVPVHNIFGRTSRAEAFKHIVEYYQYLGSNLVSWPVVSNNSWGFKCKVDAWGGGDKDDELEGILSGCDAKGMNFLATFEIGRDFRIGGKKLNDDQAAFRKGLFDGFDEFIKRYGHHKSLNGIAFGSPDFGPEYGDATIDIIRETGGLEEFTKFIHARKADLKIMTFIGARDLHMEYFSDAWGVLNRWEKSEKQWNQHLADEVLGLWKKWGRDPAELAAVEGLTVVYQYQPDDHGIYNSYTQQPRSMIYYDLDNSAPKSANINTRAVMLWNTFYETWLGFYPDVNFWYKKLWVAPDFNASEPYAGAAWARAMEHRDRNVIISGAWNRKAGGHEATFRNFAKSFRELPAAEMEDVKTAGGDAIKVRKAFLQGSTYVSLLNVTPFEEQVELSVGSENRKISLAPFAMQTVVSKGETKVSCRMKVSDGYQKYVQNRLKEFRSMVSELKGIDNEAAGKQYENHAENVRRLLKENGIHAADLALGFGLPAELELRKRVLHPEVFVAGRTSVVPKPGDKLDSWPKTALNINADNGSYLGTHLYFPNTWSGPADLSARIRICHDGQKLYVGVKVNDSVLQEKDNLTLWLSRDNYRNWRQNSQKVELLNLGISAPLDGKTTQGKSENYSWTATPEEGGYYFYAVIDLKQLKVSPGESLGFLFRVGDHDNTPNIYKASWGMDATMLIPHSENFTNWSDARNCLELKLSN